MAGSEGSTDRPEGSEWLWRDHISLGVDPPEFLIKIKLRNDIIGKGSVIRDSIIMKNTAVGENVVMDKAIVAEDVVIGNNVVIGCGEEAPNVLKPAASSPSG